MPDYGTNKKLISKEVNYLGRDFTDIRNNLIEFAKNYFPNQYNDFNEASPGMMFVEMAAYVGDVLSYYVDNQFKESLLAFKDLYLTSFDEINSPDQLINLFLSTDYNHLKHWWMDWRNKVSSNFYKNSVNVFPFHDREFQESTMSYSLKVRIGGFKNLFKMPNSFKNLFFSLFDSNIPVSSIKRGNHTALPEYFSLFKNCHCFF